jgi:hypothetical protein
MSNPEETRKKAEAIRRELLEEIEKLKAELKKIKEEAEELV